jgi:glycine/D-amino acid oxidase-like deaminating enzyme
MSGRFPTLTDLIGQLEEHRQDGIEEIEYRVNELLSILRWNNTLEGRAQNRRAKSLEEVMEYIEVLGPGDSEAALLLVLKAARIHHNAELVEAWLARVSKNGSER